MKLLNSFCRCRSKYLINYLVKCKSPRSISCSRNLSTENATQELVSYEKINLTKPSIAKWKRPPFVKGFFEGKFDVELLDFPEILDKEHLAEVESYVKDLNSLMSQKIDSMKIDETQKIPDDFLKDLKNLGIFGRMIPAKYGGLDLTHTANTRLNEVLGLDWSIYTTLAAHEFFAAQTILNHGSEAQKQRYLPKLASGEIIGALCSCEANSGSDLLSTEMRAQLNPDHTYMLTGSKTWVTNADRAGIYIVFAKTKDEVDLERSNVSAFIVDRNSDGIVVEPSQQKISLQGLQTGTVHFKEVVIPEANLLGEPREGFQIYLKALESFRIAMNTFTFGTLKVLVDSITDRLIHIERVEKSLGDRQLIRTRLSRVSEVIYAMESAAYLTAAILDSTVNPDVEFEAAALKIYCGKGTSWCLRELVELVGSSSLLPSMQIERFHRDALALAMTDSPLDVSRLFLGLSGLKMIGSKKADDILMRRNKAFFPKEAAKQFIRHWRIARGHQLYDQDIAGNIHPSLVEWGNKLENTLQKFELAVERILTEHGMKVAETQIDPVKLADVASMLYVWSAALSRCSRSYCIGLRNAQHEVRLTAALSYDLYNKAEKLLQEIFTGPPQNNESNHLFTGEQIIDCRGYFPQHPLKHNF